MNQYVNSRHARATRLHKPKGVNRARLNERKRINHNNQRHGARPSKDIKLKSSAMLVACSEELLKGLLEKYGSTPTKHDIFKGLLKAKLGDKFRRMQRKHRLKALAVASALYHVISRKPNPAAALQTLVQRMNISPPHGSDPCRTIIECLFDYGSTAEERTQNSPVCLRRRECVALQYQEGNRASKSPGDWTTRINHKLGETRGEISQAKNGVRYLLQSAGGHARNEVGVDRRRTSGEVSV